MNLEKIPKNAYFRKYDPFNDIFSKIHPWWPLFNIFPIFGENFFYHFSKILTYVLILATKCHNFDHFHQKCPVQINTINATFYYSYVNKSDGNNFWDCFKKEIFSSHPKFYDHILAPQIVPIFTIFTKNKLFRPNLPPLMTLLTNVMIINLNEIIFETDLGKNIFVPP